MTVLNLLKLSLFLSHPVFIPRIEQSFVNKLTSYPPIVLDIFFSFAEFSIRNLPREITLFFLDCCEILISYRQIVLYLTAFPPMSDQDDFEEVPRTRPASSRGQMPRNMSMNSLAKYLANSAEIDGLRSALKSGWNDYK